MKLLRVPVYAIDWGMDPNNPYPGLTITHGTSTSGILLIIGYVLIAGVVLGLAMWQPWRRWHR